MNEPIQNFSPDGASWAHTVLFQSLIIQLIESRVLTVESAQRVFDLAMQRTSKERERIPDAERLVAHIHDNLKWDDLYRWAAQQQKNKGRNGNGK